MPVVEVVSRRDVALIPAVISCLSPSNQEDCHSPWIESVQDSIGLPSVLYPQLSHVSVFGPHYRRRVRERQCGSASPKEADTDCDRVLFGFGQRVPLSTEFVCILDFPFHIQNITNKVYNFKVIFFRPHLGPTRSIGPLFS